MNIQRLGLRKGDVVIVTVTEEVWNSSDTFDQIRDALEEADRDYKVIRAKGDFSVTAIGKAIMKPEDEFLEDL